MPLSGSSGRLPKGFQAVPLFPSEAPTILRVCIVARTESSTVEETLIIVRSVPCARILLGCVVDLEGRLQRWVEIWVQTTSGMSGSGASFRENLTNAVLDERWKRQAELVRQTDLEGFTSTGFEGGVDGTRRNPIPSFLKKLPNQTFIIVNPGQSSQNGCWELCRNDRLLEAAGLPGFSGSLYRYLYQPAAGEDTRFARLFPDSPESARTISLADALLDSNDLIPVNPEGGLLLVRTHYPLTLEEFVNVLSGGAPPHGSESPVQIGEAYASWFSGASNGLDGPGYLFWGLPGVAARLCEVLHLKLHLLAELLDLVRRGTAELKLPFLNISPESFRIALGPAGAKLPLLWTSRATLITTSQAHEVSIHGGESRYFVRLEGSSFSDYFPQGLDQSFQGAGQIVVTHASQPEAGKVVLEGTLRSSTILPPFSSSDIIRLVWPFRGGELLDFFSHFEKSTVRNELRFRTFAREINPQTAGALLNSRLFPAARCSFEIIPSLSSQHDLYALGMLAIRIFFLHESSAEKLSNLGETLNALLSLREQITPGNEVSSIQKLLRNDLAASSPVWTPLLGPQRLISVELEAKEAMTLIPLEVWAEVLAFVLGLIAATDPVKAAVPAQGDAIAAPESVFWGPSAILDKLLAKTRSLLLIDWSFNREINAVIQELEK